MKRWCEVLDIPHNLPSLNLTPLRTTHIQQELWTYKKDKAFSMTPTEAINTLYYDNMDILHIDNWSFLPPIKETDDAPQWQEMPLWILKDGPYPLFKSVGLVPKSSKTIAQSQIKCASCEICSYHLGLESPDLSPPFKDMYICDVCNRTYHWQCLLKTSCCNATEREAIDANDSWACPSCIIMN